MAREEYRGERAVAAPQSSTEDRRKAMKAARPARAAHAVSRY